MFLQSVLWSSAPTYSKRIAKKYQEKICFSIVTINHRHSWNKNRHCHNRLGSSSAPSIRWPSTEAASSSWRGSNKKNGQRFIVNKIHINKVDYKKSLNINVLQLVRRDHPPQTMIIKWGRTGQQVSPFPRVINRPTESRGDWSVTPVYNNGMDLRRSRRWRIIKDFWTRQVGNISVHTKRGISK